MKKKIFFLILLILFNSCNKTVDKEQKHHDEQKNVVSEENKIALQKAKIFLRKLNLELNSKYSIEYISGNIEDIPEILIETEEFQLYLNGDDFKIRNYIVNDFKVENNTRDFKNSELIEIANDLLAKLKISDEIENFKEYKLNNLYMQDGICYSVYEKGQNLLILGFDPTNSKVVLFTIR